ncbi:hypothetical protein BDZ91DRAFT_843975 [Kalaharituber pfeilii]|nr:hypothetical protein BDZ91DRAFT_843975 [Kalaharituber pfeilii]
MASPAPRPNPTTPTSPPTLPTTRALLTHLLTRLSSLSPVPPPPPDPTNPNPAPYTNHSTLPPQSKPILLTLHSLLHHSLLPALDLLDRGLVERWIPDNDNPDDSQDADDPSVSWVYYVQSASPSGCSSRNALPPPTFHLVRVPIWHCTCANFALYAFVATTLSSPTSTTYSPKPTADDAGWIWGSTHLSPTHHSSIPVCKHLLAAVLAERCPNLFGPYVREKRGVAREEMAEKACWWD